MPFYSNPLETHPVDEAISVANNRMFYVHQLADTRGVIVDPYSMSSSSSSSGAGFIDAFGRQRISQPHTIGDYKHLYALDPNFLDKLENGGLVTFVADKAAATLSTTSNPASRAVHQTKLYHQYQPGKSQLILSSFVFKAPVPNVTKRTGYFDDRNGIYFEQTGNGTLNWVIRNYVTGAPVETGNRIPQSQWNVDPCDGSGPSGFDLDITKTQLVFIDFQWLGVGRVRCGFVHNGAMIIAHEYFHSNERDTVYISNPNLPVRCEILNTGTTVGGSFDQFYSTAHMNEQILTYMLLEQHANGEGERSEGGIFTLLKKVKRTANAKPPFYDQFEVRHNIFSLRSFWQRIHGTVADMMRVKTALDEGTPHQAVAYPTPSRDCTWKCPFFSVCPLMDDGSAAESAIEELFEISDPYAYYGINEKKGSE
jgi:hypothetical protein